MRGMPLLLVSGAVVYLGAGLWLFAYVMADDRYFRIGFGNHDALGTWSRGRYREKKKLGRFGAPDGVYIPEQGVSGPWPSTCGSLFAVECE